MIPIWLTIAGMAATILGFVAGRAVLVSAPVYYATFLLGCGVAPVALSLLGVK